MKIPIAKLLVYSHLKDLRTQISNLSAIANSVQHLSIKLTNNLIFTFGGCSINLFIVNIEESCFKYFQLLPYSMLWYFAFLFLVGY